MIRAKYMQEPVRQQPEGILLDEYVRCARDLHEGNMTLDELKQLEEYVTLLRDEIVARMRWGRHG